MMRRNGMKVLAGNSSFIEMKKLNVPVRIHHNFSENTTNPSPVVSNKLGFD